MKSGHVRKYFFIILYFSLVLKFECDSFSFNSVLLVGQNNKFPFILREVAAIGVRLSHASLASQETGVRLSNTSTIYLMVWDNPGKLRISPDREVSLECILPERQRHKMSRRLIRLLVR